MAYLVFAVNRSRRRRASKLAVASEPTVPVVARVPRSLDPRGAGPPSSPAVTSATPPPVSGPVAAAPTGSQEVLPALARGVSLPCDLSPLTGARDRSGCAERVVFMTEAAPGEVVQREFEAAFEDVGAHIAWYTPDLGVLRRDDLEANVALHMAPKAVHEGGVEAFPTAPPGSVVVDLWVPSGRRINSGGEG